MFEFGSRNEAPVDQLLANIVDEIPKNRAPAVSDRIDMNDRVDVDVSQPRLAKKTVRPPAHMKIDALRTRVRLIDGAQARIFGRGWIHDAHLEVRLEARDPASRPNQRNNLADHQFRLWHFHEDKAHMGAVERRAEQSGVVRVTLLDLDLRQPKVGGEPARLLDEMRAAVDPQNRGGRPDALRQEMQRAAQTAPDIDDPLAQPDADLSNCASESAARSAICRLRRSSSGTPRPSR
jgi:hypothetical protein